MTKEQLREMLKTFALQAIATHNDDTLTDDEKHELVMADTLHISSLIFALTGISPDNLRWTTSGVGNPNSPAQLPKDETLPNFENTGLPLELPDEPLNDGHVSSEELILTSDEQRRLFDEVGIPLDGDGRSTPPHEETLTSCVSQWKSQSQHDIADCKGTPMAVKTTFPFDEDDDDPQRLRERVVKWANEPNPFDSSGLPERAAGEAQEFRPFLRPPTPILTLLDDGSREQGEDVRIRQETLTIGRTAGDVRIPHDIALSGAHAEIRRTPWQGGYEWHLHDLDSVNGTFAKTAEAVLHKDTIIMLGSRRFRLEHKLRPDISIVDGITLMYSDPPIPESMCPVLTEAYARPGALEFALRSDRLIIGRMGSGADIEIDDPLLDERHAELKRLQDGSWTITSEGTRNGIWVSISAALLSPLCYFRCGDQRFRFVIP